MWPKRGVQLTVAHPFAALGRPSAVELIANEGNRGTLFSHSARVWVDKNLQCRLSYLCSVIAWAGKFSKPALEFF